MIGVFGANGFIGRHVVSRLLRDGHEVVAVGRVVDLPPSRCLRVVEADFNDLRAMEEALRGVDQVVQLVGSSSPAMGNDEILNDIGANVLPHVDFLNACLGAGVARVVFLSSGGTVYGPVLGRTPLKESLPTNPICSHGLTKLMVEKLIGMLGHTHSLDYAVLRVANCYGPGQLLKRGQGLVPALLERHRRGQPVTVFGDGSATRDYVYVDDVVDAIVRSLALPGRQQLTLNVGTGRGRSVLDVVSTLGEVGGLAFDLEYKPARTSDVEHVALDISLAHDQLGWRPETDFREGLARTVAAWQTREQVTSYR